MPDNTPTKGLFVTGTDTGVGKTVVAAGVIGLARERGLRVRAMKPIETGCSVRSGLLHPEDGALLHEASNQDLTLDECVPFRFSLPASPYRSAAMEGKRLKAPDLTEHVLSVAEGADLTVVEGAGGLMVPIEEDFMMIDLVERLGFPVLLVARSSLGTVNHTLLSLEALERRGIRPKGVVLSSVASGAGPEEAFTPGDLAGFVGDVPVTVLPHLTPETLADPRSIAQTMADLWPEETLAQWLSG